MSCAEVSKDPENLTTLYKTGGNMRSLITLLSVLIFAIFTTPGHTEKPLQFSVGFKGGTYEYFAKTLNKLPGVSFKIINTQGSNDIVRYVNAGRSDFGIAQLDIIFNLDSRESRATENIRFVLPLYSEEVHVIAKNSIRSISDLSGKTISVGARNSGTSETALIILSQLDLLDGSKAVRRMRFMEPEQGLKKLENGQIDAVFIVAGAPVKLLRRLPSGFSSKGHLLSFNKRQYKKVTQNQYHYKKSRIRAGRYPWQTEAAKTISVVSSIITNKRMPDSDVSNLINKIFSNRNRLNGMHPKWKEVDNETIKWYLDGRPYQFHKGAKEALKGKVLGGPVLSE